MAWSEFFAAVALLLVLEGVLPFLSPELVRRTLARVAEMGDRELRMAGFFSMLVGLGLLFWVRS